MKTYAPKGLNGADLRGLLGDLVATPAQVAKFLRVTERSVWRWLADDSAPFAVLAALWHETARGREVTSCDVGNELVLTRAGQRISQQGEALAVVRLARVLAISDTGSSNDPFFTDPFSAAPSSATARPPTFRMTPFFNNSMSESESVSQSLLKADCLSVAIQK